MKDWMVPRNGCMEAITGDKGQLEIAALGTPGSIPHRTDRINNLPFPGSVAGCSESDQKDITREAIYTCASFGAATAANLSRLDMA